MRYEFFNHVRKCDLSPRAIHAQHARVGLYSAQPSSQPIDKFIDFVGPLECSKRRNIAILVVVDPFSNFLYFYPVRKIASRVILDYLQRGFITPYGSPKYLVTDNARVFCFKPFKGRCFR